MKKVIVLSAIFCLAISSVAWAAPNFSNATLKTPGTERTLVLPQAADHSPVIHLGSRIDPETGGVVEGYAFVHYKNANAKGGSAKPPKPTPQPTCYGFLSSGAKWKTVEPWLVNPTNSRGLAADFLLNNLTADISKWEDAADGVVGNGMGVDILGDGVLTYDSLIADTASPDGKNEVYFADVSSSNAIAVTIVWGIFGGAPQNRKLVEWDMIYDDVDYDWSAAGEAGKMDFENIATHELGHSAGLADLYTSACGEETMYGYASYGETKKRDLNAGDIAGANSLY